MIPIACNGDPRAIIARIPLGSKLSELDDHLGDYFDSSDVDEWTPGGTDEKNQYGSFDVQRRGSYGGWSLMTSKSERNAFTGKLWFWHLSGVIPDLAPSYVVVLIYVKGVLKEKDYGYLSG